MASRHHVAFWEEALCRLSYFAGWRAMPWGDAMAQAGRYAAAFRPKPAPPRGTRTPTAPASANRARMPAARALRSTACSITSRGGDMERTEACGSER